MKNLHNNLFYLMAGILAVACSPKNNEKEVLNKIKTLQNTALYDTILAHDSIFWEAYNNCNLELQERIYADDIEFYHDQAGLVSSKQTILMATKINICGKIRRELVEGSVEIFPINNYGAIEMGRHRFYSLSEKEDGNPIEGRFIFFWQNVNNTWVIKKVVSLHH